MSERRFEEEPTPDQPRDSWKRGLLLLILIVAAALVAGILWAPNW